MGYTDDEALSEIMKRSKKVSYKRKKKRDTILVCASFVIAICAVGIVLSIPAGDQTYAARTLYGSFLLNPSTGGYILAAMIAFALGVAVAIICKRYQNEHNDFKD